MSLIVSAKMDYTPVEAGTYSAVCIVMADLGTQETSFGTKKQIFVQWELDAERDDGERHTIGRRYTASLSKNAALRKDLDNWRGRPFTKEELEGFSLVQIVGKPCMILVTHTDRDGQVYANVASVAKLPKGMAAINPHTEPVAWDMDDRNMEDFERLPEWLRDVIKKSPDWDKPPEPAAAGEEDFDDDILF